MTRGVRVRCCCCGVWVRAARELCSWCRNNRCPLCRVTVRHERTYVPAADKDRERRLLLYQARAALRLPLFPGEETPMIEREGIPGSISPEASRIRWHKVDDVPEGTRYRADVPDGILVAMLSRDEVAPGKHLWHLSVSHRDAQGQPDRCPTWDELKHAFYRLVHADVPFVLIFPRRSTPAAHYVNVYETCLHLWESTEGAIDQ